MDCKAVSLTTTTTTTTTTTCIAIAIAALAAAVSVGGRDGRNEESGGEETGQEREAVDGRRKGRQQKDGRNG